MTWLITALIAAGVLAALLPALLLLLALIDPPRTEEGWRRELTSTGGFEHRILADAYCIFHHKKGKGTKNGQQKEAKASSALVGGQSLSSSGSSATGSAYRRPGGRVAKQSHDDHHHELVCGGQAGIHRLEVQDPHGGASSADSSASSRLADKQNPDRYPSPESPASEPLQAGSGGRGGGRGAGSEPATFWEKLVANGERLGV